MATGSVQNIFSLKGKTALVTGASRGLGQAIAVGLAQAGADVICCSSKIGGTDETVRETTARFMGLKDGNFSLTYDNKVKMITKIPDGDSRQKSAVLKNILKKLLRSEVKK